ncbi:MAG: ribonuclease J [Candidatus Portnoybacteria bacterium CG08_land_8_20_14_0_20_40_83]|uniref:Ribonuclease J n=3 Tax=Bacteria candidate phyla TaxID=1783234 RepID=A0A2M7YPP9_9BACT|nr:MAG: ribonuclease J [Candidatus Portnoybacteria bacterium CG08_land_8_20_14_0_20_40_83]PIY74699.1 MAG: ribonuclease J [Candidatus Portnoybacteria bacterium CG_4_10_14_0_8_um_filter_40_50]PJA64963.1 MAG: ribonuclease J [Candidatus Portnoybacteria bacterium CG_4_9_14_3_um_filter_40_10]
MHFAFLIFTVVTQINRRRYSSGQTFRRSGRQQSSERGPMEQPKARSPRQQQNILKIIPLGGQEEVGRNMTVFEYGDDIVILDMGLQFPEEDMPGIDYIIPDARYLKGKERNIRGVLLSHGHLDHIGAIPHLMQKLNWPPIYGAKMTLALVRKRLEEAQLTKFLKAYEIKSENENLSLGNFKINFFPATHSIMDALGVIIGTPMANIIHMGDWRYDLNPVSGQPTDFSHLARWNTKTVPSVLMMESLGSTKEGHQIPEQEIYENIKQIFQKAPGRIIIATFASMVERVAWIIDIAEKLGKKVAIDGYSMKVNIEIAKRFGYVKFNQGTLIDVKRIHDYPDNKIVVVCTGAQGEDRAVLMRIANGEHRQIHLKKEDTIIFSSSVIPGNERSIQRLKDNLYRQCDNVIHKEIMDVHGGGHALIEDIKLLIQQVKPQYLIPVYANHYLLREGAKVAESIGFPRKNIFVLDNGSVAEITKNGLSVTGKKIPIEYVFVDGLGVGDIGNIVLRDRQAMAKDGMFVIIVTVDSKTGHVVNSPDIISRGFIYMRESKELLYEVRQNVKKIVHQATAQGHSPINQTYIKENLRDKIGQFLYNKTQRRPMVLPVVIEV